MAPHLSSGERFFLRRKRSRPKHGTKQKDEKNMIIHDHRLKKMCFHSKLERLEIEKIVGN